MKYLINWKDKQYIDDIQIQVEIVVKHNFYGLKFTFNKCEEKVGIKRQTEKIECHLQEWQTDIYLDIQSLLYLKN
jgi:hypothetical protein